MSTRSWFARNKWPLIGLPIAAVALLAAVWFLANPADRVEVFGPTHIFEAEELIELEGITIDGVEAELVTSDPGYEILGARFVLVTADALITSPDTTLLCSPPLVSQETGEEFRTVYLSPWDFDPDRPMADGCVGDSDGDPSYLMYVIPEGLRGDFVLRLEDLPTPIGIRLTL